MACTSGGSPTCVGVGGFVNSSGVATGIIKTTPSDLGSTSSDTVPAGVTGIAQVTCPSTNGCYALGTTSAGPVLLAGAVGQSSPLHDTWSTIAPPGTTFTNLTSIACPTSSTCELTGSAIVGAAPTSPIIIRLDGDPATLATTGTWTPTFTADSLPATVTSVGTVTCPTAGGCESIGTISDSTSTFDPTILTTAVSAGGASAWSPESTFPTGATSITGISCTSTTCVAIGSAAGAASVWTGDLTASPDDWSTAGTFPTITTGAVTSVACGNPASSDTADCVVAATEPNLSVPGELIEGSLTGGSWSWNPVTVPSGSTYRFFTGVACEAKPSASRSTCAAVGGTSSGPVVLTSGSGPSGTWSTSTPSSLSGATVSGIPLETTQSIIPNWTTQVAAVTGATNASSLPSVLYPQAYGYNVAAGDCVTEATSASIAALNAPPGGTASATVPLGLLALQVINSSLAPVGGATVTLTATSTTSPTNVCGADKYVLPVTDAFGQSRVAVPYGTYSYQVKVGGTTTSPSAAIEVDAGSTKVTNGTAATTYLPSPALVPSS